MFAAFASAATSLAWVAAVSFSDLICVWWSDPVWEGGVDAGVGVAAVGSVSSVASDGELLRSAFMACTSVGFAGAVPAVAAAFGRLEAAFFIVSFAPVAAVSLLSCVAALSGAVFCVAVCADKMDASRSEKSALPLLFLEPCDCAPATASAVTEFPTLELAVAIVTNFTRNGPQNRKQGADQLKVVRNRAFHRTVPKHLSEIARA